MNPATIPTDAELDAILHGIQEPCTKSSIAYRALSRAEMPMRHGKLTRLAKALGIGRSLMENAKKVVLIFKAYPEIRARWESDIIAGLINISADLSTIEEEAKRIEDSKPGSPLARKGGIEWPRLDVKADTSLLKGLRMEMPNIEARKPAAKRKAKKAK